MIFFTSDTHFNHKNIIRFCNRPFSNVHTMNQIMIANWNSKVGKDDLVYHLGDVGLGNKSKQHELVTQLNGTIILIRGNHDPKNQELAATEWFKECGFASVYEYKNLKFEEFGMTLVHNPNREIERSYQLVLHGHFHSSKENRITKKLYGNLLIDVGVDGNDFFPYSFNEVVKLVEDSNHFSKG